MRINVVEESFNKWTLVPLSSWEKAAAVVIQFKQHIFSHWTEVLENSRKYHFCPKPTPKEVIVYFFHYSFISLTYFLLARTKKSQILQKTQQTSASVQQQPSLHICAELKPWHLARNISCSLSSILREVEPSALEKLQFESLTFSLHKSSLSWCLGIVLLLQHPSSYCAVLQLSAQHGPHPLQK